MPSRLESRSSLNKTIDKSNEDSKNDLNAQFTKNICGVNKTLWGVNPTPIKHKAPRMPKPDPILAMIPSES